MTRFRRRKRRVTWLPTIWETEVGLQNLGKNALQAFLLIPQSTTVTGNVGAGDIPAPLRWAEDLRLERLIGDVTLIETASKTTGGGTGTQAIFSYGFAIVRYDPITGTVNDLNDWQVQDNNSQKRWLWRRGIVMNTVQGFPQGVVNYDYLPWGTWHDIRPRARCRFGEEMPALITYLGIDPMYDGTTGIVYNMRSLWSHH